MYCIDVFIYINLKNSLYKLVIMSYNNLRNAVFSFIIPGLGQGFNGDSQKALVLFGIAVVLHVFIYFFLNNLFGSLLNTVYHLYAGYDAYISTVDD